jgi:hypothetical protein
MIATADLVKEHRELDEEIDELNKTQLDFDTAHDLKKRRCGVKTILGERLGKGDPIALAYATECGWSVPKDLSMV